MKKANQLFKLVITLTILCSPIKISAQTGFEWGRQIGTKAEDFGKSIDVDSTGNVYITGWTNDEQCNDSKGAYDFFVCKMDPNGKTIWYKHFGTEKNERAQHIACLNNSVVVAGSTDGNFGGINHGDKDAFVLKMDTDGNIEWIKQFGADSVDEFAFVTMDEAENVYCLGKATGKVTDKPVGKQDIFMVKLNKTGELAWKVQFGTVGDDNGAGLFVDKNQNVYVCGTVNDPLWEKRKSDAFYAKYTKEGQQSWYKEFGTDDYESGNSIQADEKGNIYIGGSTAGSIGGEQLGNGDGFLIKINSKHEMVWKKQFGTENWDGVLSVRFNPTALSLIVSGCQNYDKCRGFCREYDLSGNMLWKNEFTALDNEKGGTCGKDAVIDKYGNIYHTGGTSAGIFGENKGSHDIYVVKMKLIKK